MRSSSIDPNTRGRVSTDGRQGAIVSYSTPQKDSVDGSPNSPKKRTRALSTSALPNKQSERRDVDIDELLSELNIQKREGSARRLGNQKTNGAVPHHLGMVPPAVTIHAPQRFSSEPIYTYDRLQDDVTGGQPPKAMYASVHKHHHRTDVDIDDLPPPPPVDYDPTYDTPEILQLDI